MSTMAEPLPADGAGELLITDVAAIPDDPPAELFYRHRPSLRTAAGQLVRRWEVILTLAERDLRAAYKQAVLGIGWALINPVLSLLLINLVFSRAFHTTAYKGVPKPLFFYVGILAWGFFAGAVGSGSSSLLQNKSMMAKTHFPRECFPLSQVVESAFTSSIAVLLLPLVLFPLYGFMPKLTTLWCPLYVAVEIPFTVGALLLISSIVVQMRDLNQLVSMGLSLGVFATPIIWSFSQLPHGLVTDLYSFFIPIGPVIDGVRQSMLLGHAPHWGLLALATCGSLLYLVGGFAVFKRLEVNFADLA